MAQLALTQEMVSPACAQRDGTDLHARIISMTAPLILATTEENVSTVSTGEFASVQLVSRDQTAESTSMNVDHLLVPLGARASTV